MRWVTAQSRQLHFLIEKSRQGGDSSSRASFQLKKNERFLLPHTVSVHDSIVLRESPICGDGFFSIRRHLAFVSPTVVLPTTSSDRASYWAPTFFPQSQSKKIVTKTEKQKSEKTFPTMSRHWQSVTLRWSWCDRWEMAPQTQINPDLLSFASRARQEYSLLAELGRNIPFCQS